MSRASKSQASFNGGELTPRLNGRVDQSIYQIGASEMTGWLPVLQGPAVAAPGTRFVEVAKGPGRLIPFEYNVTQGYVIEATAGTFRFFTNDVRIETAPGVPYEVEHPWSYEQLLELDREQSADVLYLVRTWTKPKTLSRTSATTFALGDMVIENGPFEDGNTDEAVTLTVSATSGAITITVSSPIFAEGDAGSLFKIEAKDFGDTPAWEPGITVNAGERRVSDGKVYEAIGNGRTGTVPPVHVRGAAWDGMASGTDVNDMGYGVRWDYLYGAIGIVRITGVSGGGTTATADVLSRLADSLVSVASSYWAFGAFSDRRGWPSAICEWGGRLVLAKDNWLFGSTIGGYTDFSERDPSGSAQRDLAFRVRLPDPNPIRWLAADVKLMIGTSRAEYVAEQLIVQSDAASAPQIQIDRQSSRGVRATKPVQAGGRVLFIQRAGRKVLELGYSLQSDRFEAPDLTRFAEHIGKPGFVELAWQQEPEGIIWAVRRDGTLAAMTYSAEEEVHGWATRTMGGGLLARSVATISDPAGERDQLWILAERNGVWWVLLQQKIWETKDPATGAWFVDAGLSYSGEPVASGSGLQHLAGQTVTVLADGKPHPEILIGGGGTWAINYPASIVTIGFPYPARITPMPIEAGGDDGAAQGKIQRISRVALRLLESQGIRISVQGLNAAPLETRVPANPLDQSVPLYTGDVVLDTIGQHGRYAQVTIERFQPTPATLLAVIPTVTTSPR